MEDEKEQSDKEEKQEVGKETSMLFNRVLLPSYEHHV